MNDIQIWMLMIMVSFFGTIAYRLVKKLKMDNFIGIWAGACILSFSFFKILGWYSIVIPILIIAWAVNRKKE